MDRVAGAVRAIKVSVQAQPRDLGSWLALAARLESGGFHALVVGDHPGSGASPWPVLGAAAAVTRTLRLGTYVLQAGVREPVHAAADAATLEVLAPGRVLLGLGAGHTPRESQLQLIRSEARGVGNTPELEALVQVVTVTEHRARHLRELSGRLVGTTPEDVARTPFVLVGTVHEVAAQMRRQADELGIARYVVREQAVPQMEAVLPLLGQ